MKRENFFKEDPYRGILSPIFERHRVEIRNKAKSFYREWKGDLRGWNHYIWYGHSVHNTLEDPKGGFHFYVNTRYIPLKQLLKEIKEVGFKIVEKKISDRNAMRLIGDETGPNKSEVFVRIKLK